MSEAITDSHRLICSLCRTDTDVEDVLEQIGFRSVPDRKAEAVAEEGRMFEYPEPPERAIRFGALLKKCGYTEDVIEQYTEVADIEVQYAAESCAEPVTDAEPSPLLVVCADYRHPDRFKAGRGRKPLCVH